MKCLLIITTASIASAAALGAQTADATSVPRPLLIAVLHFQGINSLGTYGPPTGEPIVTPGVPATVAPMFGTPPRARIFGAVTWLRTVDVFAAREGTIEDVRKWFADDFVKRGYRPVDENSGDQRLGGFRDPGPTQYAGFCSATDLLTVDARPSGGAGQVEYRVRISFSHSNCISPGARGGGQATRGELPILDNPVNASRSFASCQDRQSASSGTGATLSTTMTPTELIRHYERQMPTMGWTQVPVPSDANSYWVKKDSTGAEQLLTLTARSSRETPGCRSVQMMLSRETRTTR